MWADLKRIISRFYVSVKSCNFIFFAKEVEWRKKTSNLSIDKKLDNIKFIFNHISNIVEWDLFSKEEIEDFEKNEYENDLDDNSGEEDEINSDDNSSIED